MMRETDRGGGGDDADADDDVDDVDDVGDVGDVGDGGDGVDAVIPPPLSTVELVFFSGSFISTTTTAAADNDFIFFPLIGGEFKNNTGSASTRPIPAMTPYVLGNNSGCKPRDSATIGPSVAPTPHIQCSKFIRGDNLAMSPLKSLVRRTLPPKSTQPAATP